MRKLGLAASRQALSREASFSKGKLTKPALISLSVLTGITFLGNFTQLQLASALPTIVNEFHISLTTGQWLTSIFQLVMGVMVPLTGFLTKRFSTKQIVITSMSFFTFGSLLSWQASSFSLVLFGRMLEAIGTGAMWPVLQITIFSIYPLAKRGMAMGTVGVAMSVAPAIGPAFGGWQTDSHGWRSVFLSLAVLGTIALVAAIFLLHNFGETDKTVNTDFFSVSLSIFGFGGLMFGFTNIENFPVSSPMVWVPTIIGITGILWFVFRQLHHDKPLLNLRVLKVKNFTVGTIIASLSFFAFSSVTVILPLYIQTDRGFSATMSGLVMLPGAIGTAIAQFFGGRLLDRMGARPVALTGCSILLVGTVGMSFIGLHTWIGMVSVLQFVRQIGMGFTLMPLTTWALNNLPSKDLSAGSAVTNTARQISGAVGAPVLVILMDSITNARQKAVGSGMSTQIASNIFGVQWALRISACICVGMLTLVYFGVRGEDAGSGRAMSRMIMRHMHFVHIPGTEHARQSSNNNEEANQKETTAAAQMTTPPTDSPATSNRESH